MQEFKEKVAVITGAASGIGYALAERCAQEGMKVVLADIDEKYLRKAQRKLEKLGATFITMVTDVSKASDMEALAKKTLETYSEVHLLFNNAGVFSSKYAWNFTLKDWEWQLGVNLWGVIHGIRIFVPIMLKQDNECHIINTASMEGLISGSGPGGTIYGLSKHGIVSITETLRNDLDLMGGTKLKVSVLCPGQVRTRVLSANHRTEEFQNDPDKIVEDTRFKDHLAKYRDVSRETSIIEPEEVADITFQAIKEEKLYIITHKDSLMKRAVKERFDEILKAFND